MDSVSRSPYKMLFLAANQSYVVSYQPTSTSTSLTIFKPTTVSPKTKLTASQLSHLSFSTRYGASSHPTPDSVRLVLFGSSRFSAPPAQYVLVLQRSLSTLFTSPSVSASTCSPSALPTTSYGSCSQHGWVPTVPSASV